MLGLGLVALFGSRRAILGGSSLAGAGALAVLVLAFIAGQGWNKEEKVRKLAAMEIFSPPKTAGKKSEFFH